MAKRSDSCARSGAELRTYCHCQLSRLREPPEELHPLVGSFWHDPSRTGTLHSLLEVLEPGHRAACELWSTLLSKGVYGDSIGSLL